MRHKPAIENYQKLLSTRLYSWLELTKVVAAGS